MPDLEVLRLAASPGRVLVTHDARTMPAYLAAFVQSGVSPGVIFIPQSLEIGAAVRDLTYLWDMLEADELRNQICRIPNLSVIRRPARPPAHGRLRADLRFRPHGN